MVYQMTCCGCRRRIFISHDLFIKMKFIIQNNLFLCIFHFAHGYFAIIKFDQAATLYNEVKSNFRGTDPVPYQSVHVFQTVCRDLLWNARVYSLIGLHQNIPTPSNPILTPIQISDGDLEYRPQRVINTNDSHIYVFRCPMPIQNQRHHFWYVTYGFSDDLMFLLHRSGDDETALEIFGVLELIPRLSERRGEPLERRFRDIMSVHSEWRLSDPTFYTLYHFRLCSSVQDTIWDYESNLGTPFYDNYAQGYGFPVSERRAVIFEHLVDRNRLTVTGIPCVVNGNLAEPNFYIVINPTDSTCVFVMKLRHDPHDRQMKFLVAYEALDLTVLEELRGSSP